MWPNTMVSLYVYNALQNANSVLSILTSKIVGTPRHETFFSMCSAESDQFLPSFRMIVRIVNNMCLLKCNHFIHSYIWILTTRDLFIFYYYCIGQSEWRIRLSLNRFQKYSFRTEVIVLANEKHSFHLT